VIPTINSDYFPEQHKPIDPSKGTEFVYII